MFKSVQDEYVAEGIDWVEVDYEDNTDCLKMIEGRLGLLAILEEETARASTDEKLSNKLEKILSDSPYFEKPRLVRCGFEIRHYAGVVRYDANTFLEKNADALAPDIITLLRTSSVPFVAKLYNPEEPPVVADSSQQQTQKKKKKRSRRGSSIFMKTVTPISNFSVGSDERNWQDERAVHPLHQAKCDEKRVRVRQQARVRPAQVLWCGRSRRYFPGCISQPHALP